ncbi:MAG: chromate transporter [Candidatus Cloacimonadaceae bacterium]|nr:chromate transporter [Candidatus Cloacimonadaceae bacterium]
MLYLSMLYTFIKIGLFSFGGGYAILAMIQHEVVINNQWLSSAEFFDIVAISQMTPGPIAINAATFIGYKKAGILGGVICTFGVILPSLIIMTLITVSYLMLKHKAWFKAVFRHLRPLSIGLIAAAALIAGRDAIVDLFSIMVFIICFILSWRFKVNPFLMLLGAGVVGFFFG